MDGPAGSSESAPASGQWHRRRARRQRVLTSPYVARVGALELDADEIAAHDDQRELGADGERALVGLLRRLVPPGQRVLDAGGGSGTAVRALAAAGGDVVLVDWSCSMLRRARARGAVCVAGDLTLLPFPDGTFPLVHAAYAVQNVVDWRAALTECARVVGAGGRLVVAWGAPPVDPRAAALERLLLDRLPAGVRGERSGLTTQGAGRVLAERGLPLSEVAVVRGTQVRTPREVLERTARNPYRSAAPAHDRRDALRGALQEAQDVVGPLDVPIELAVERALHVYGR